MPCYSLRTLLIVMTLFALIVVGLTSPTDFWSGVLFSVTLSLLLTTVLIIIYRSGAARAFATGFLVFGCGYALCVFPRAPRPVPQFMGGPQFPGGTQTTVNSIYGPLHRQRSINLGQSDGVKHENVEHFDHFREIYECGVTLLLAVVGGIIGRWLFLTQHGESSKTSPSSGPEP